MAITADEVLAEVGLSAADLDRLRAADVVGRYDE